MPIFASSGQLILLCRPAFARQIDLAIRCVVIVGARVGEGGRWGAAEQVSSLGAIIWCCSDRPPPPSKETKAAYSIRELFSGYSVSE